MPPKQSFFHTDVFGDTTVPNSVRLETVRRRCVIANPHKFVTVWLNFGTGKKRLLDKSRSGPGPSYVKLIYIHTGESIPCDPDAYRS